MKKQQYARFDLGKIERLAEGKDIAAVTVHYVGVEDPVTYEWEDRRQIGWSSVRRCRLDFVKPKYYIVDGDACNRPGFRVRGS